MNVRRATVLSGIVLLVVQLAATQDLNVLPPISWSCPMHPDVIETKAGICPICSMELKGVRLETVWSCPVHSVIEQKTPGKCPICRRDLGQVTVALSFTCTNHPETDSINPGKCPDGTAMIPKHSVRAHGNHNPQHGGVFFMAPDNWHHLEGTYPEQGVFRLYLYDDFAKPIPLNDLQQATARIIKEEFNAATQKMLEIETIPLQRDRDGRYLEAKVDRPELPAEVIAKIQFKPDGPEHRFDFVFPEFSKEDATTIVTTAGLETEIPDNIPQIIERLQGESARIGVLIEKGSFGEIYVPAFQAKDLALALDPRMKDLASDRRAGARAALERVVRLAWQLDALGDQGNREAIVQSYTAFARAVEDLTAAFSGAR